MRLIDADALPVNNRPTFFELIDAIEDAHTIDAVPVVRCQECKHHGDPIKCPMCFEEFIDLPDGKWDYNIFDLAKDDGFCHEGERRSDEG